MTTIPFETAQAAWQRSAEMWAAVRGAGWREGNVTQYLFGAIERPDDPEEPTPLPDGVDVALVVTRDERLNKLVLESELTADEWAAIVGLYPAWAVGVTYAIGDLRAYDGRLYKCVQAHPSQSDWTPPATPNLWTDTAPAGVIPAWKQPTGAQDSYALAAQATHVNATWQSRRNNNVWEPGVRDSGWLRIEPYPSAWYYLGSEGYPLDWQATHNGKTWRNTSAGNFYEPGVWGWVAV